MLVVHAAGITVAQPQPQQDSPAQQPSPTQHSFPVLIGSVLAFVGIVLASVGIAMLIWQHRCTATLGKIHAY